MIRSWVTWVDLEKFMTTELDRRLLPRANNSFKFSPSLEAFDIHCDLKMSFARRRRRRRLQSDVQECLLSRRSGISKIFKELDIAHSQPVP